MEPSSIVIVIPDIEGYYDERLLPILEQKEYFDEEPVAVALFNVSYSTFIPKPNIKVIVLGDLMHHGPKSVKCALTILNMKKRSPDQVVCLLGNRDIVMLRLDYELSMTSVSFNNIRWWGNIYNEYLQLHKDRIIKEGETPIRLEFMLAKTLGAPNFFNQFKEETNGNIHELKRFNTVFKSYLNLCQLGYVHLGVLYTHSCVTELNVGRIPDIEMPMIVTTSEQCEKWIAALNNWYREQWLCMEQHSTRYPKSLFLYAEPTIDSTKNTWSDRNNSSILASKPWDKEYCMQLTCPKIENIFLNVCGHVPVGPLPCLVICPNKLHIMFTDTSNFGSKNLLFRLDFDSEFVPEINVTMIGASTNVTFNTVDEYPEEVASASFEATSFVDMYRVIWKQAPNNQPYAIPSYFKLL
jgi:hypothetical protein